MRQRQQNGWVEETGKQPRTWTGYFYVYEDGKRLKRSKVIGRRSELKKSEAEDVLRAYLRGEVTRISPAGSAPQAEPDRLAIHVERYQRLKRGDWGKANRATMASLFKCHVIPSIGQMATRGIKQSDIKEWITALAEAQSRTIAQKALSHVKAIFEQLVDDDVLVKNPARRVRLPKNTRAVSKAFYTVEQCHALLGAATGKDKAILRVLLSCGLRPSELFALRLEDVRPGQLRIDEGAVPCDKVKDTKTTQSDAWVPMSPETEALLRGHAIEHGITEPKAFLFATRSGRPISHANYLRRAVKRIAVRAGVMVVEKTTASGRQALTSSANFQMMRRTVATHSQKHGEIKSVQGLLRHAEPETTLKHYQQRLDPEVIKAHQGWDSELSGAKLQN